MFSDNKYNYIYFSCDGPVITNYNFENISIQT